LGYVRECRTASFPSWLSVTVTVRIPLLPSVTVRPRVFAWPMVETSSFMTIAGLSNSSTVLSAQRPAPASAITTAAATRYIRFMAVSSPA